MGKRVSKEVNSYGSIQKLPDYEPSVSHKKDNLECEQFIYPAPLCSVEGYTDYDGIYGPFYRVIDSVW